MKTVKNFTNNVINSLSRTEIHIPEYGILLTPEVLTMEVIFNLNGMSYGHFILNDVDNNVFNSYPLVGGEAIEIIIISPENEITIFKKTYVISGIKIITRDVKIENNKNKYRIDFVSTLTFIDSIKTISKGYSEPKTTSEIITDILLTDLKCEDSKIPIFIEQSSTSFDTFVIPYSHPLQIIHDLAEISTNDNNNDSFVFFEDSAGINFVSVTKMFSQKPRYKLDRKNVSDYNTGLSMTNITKERFVSGTNLLDAIHKKGLGGTFIHYDSNTKEAISEVFVLDEDHFNSITTISNNSLFKNNYYKASYQSHNKILTRDSSYGKVYGLRNIRKSMFDANKLNVTIPGTLDIQIGNIVYLEFIADQSELNLPLSGNWIVTSYKLKYSASDENIKATNKQTLETELIISKDGYGTMKRDVAELAKLIKTSTNINNNINSRGN